MYDHRYDDIDFAKRKANDYIKSKRRKNLPSCRRLRKDGYHSLANCIESVHGGAREFRDALGLQQLRAENGSWKRLEYRLAKAREAMITAGTKTLPDKKRLDEIGYSALAFAISSNEGFPEFRKLLGEKEHEVFKRYEDINYGLNIARRVIVEHGLISLPSDNKLRKLGYGTLAYFIYKKYGTKKFRKLLGETKLMRDRGKLKSLDYVLSESKRIMDERGIYHFPKKDELSIIDSSLAQSCVKNFGYNVVRARFVSRYTLSLECSLRMAVEYLNKHPEYRDLPKQEVLEKDKQMDICRAVMMSNRSFDEFREMVREYQQRLGNH
jgi:hypothetical protein